LSEPEPLNAFESVEELPNSELDDVVLPVYFWEQSDVPSPWNIYWTEAAAYGEGLELDDPVFGNSWTKCWGTHAWFDCDLELPCECEGHNCFSSKKHFRPGGMAPSEWTCSVRAIRHTPVADYSAPGVNTTRRVAYRPPIAVSPFLFAHSVPYFKQTLWHCGQL